MYEHLLVGYRISDISEYNIFPGNSYYSNKYRGKEYEIKRGNNYTVYKSVTKHGILICRRAGTTILHHLFFYINFRTYIGYSQTHAAKY